MQGQKLCDKDIHTSKSESFIILCGTFPQKDSLIEIDIGKFLVNTPQCPQLHQQVLDYVLLAFRYFFFFLLCFQLVSQHHLNTPEIVYSQRQFMGTEAEILANKVALNRTTHR
jgi:hypothetical protein